MRKREQKRRLLFEALGTAKTYFLTLSYRGSTPIEYEDVQKYLKRCRKHIGKRYAFRFFCVAELGGKGGRKHYHMLVFAPEGARTRDFRLWKEGFLYLKTVDTRAKIGTYVTKTMGYVQKSEGIERVRASQRLGSAYLETPFIAEVRKHFPRATVNGFREGKFFYRAPKTVTSRKPEPLRPLTEQEREDWNEVKRNDRPHREERSYAEQLADAQQNSYETKALYATKFELGDALTVPEERR